MYNYRSFIFVSLLILLFNSLTATSQNIEVLITGIRSDKGQIVIGIFKNNETFQAEKPFLSKKFEKKTISKGEMTITFNLDAGIYGLTLLDDEDHDNLMKYNFFGMPEEGFGFSNYYFTGFVKPSFDTFKFEVKNNQKKKITIKVRYL